jgi:nucleotide sugar dehydrogenase
LSEIDAIFFTLGTSAPNFESCLSADSGEIDNIEEILISLLANKLRKKEILFVFRTTLFLGSMDRLKANIESKTNLIEGVDFHMSFVPERLMEGDAINEEQSLPKIIGAFNDHGYEITKKLFESIGSGLIIRVSNPRSAEFCKLSDNSYRNTNFAFSNDLAIWAAANGVDVHEVIKTINVGYDRNNIPKPGFVSGYCLGKDPYIFEYGFNKKVKGRTFQSLWYYGRRTNDFLVDYVSKKVFDQANIHKKNISHLNIAVLGLSFKEDIDDFRMSHSFDLIESLIANGLRIPKLLKSLKTEILNIC